MKQRFARTAAVAFAWCLAVFAQVADYTLVAAPGTVTLGPGLTQQALVFNGQLPGPTLNATQGQVLRVRFVNQLSAPSSLHFHGINMQGGMDGVPGVTRPAVAPGQEFVYEFTVPDSGTFWYHPHVEDQMTSGLYGMVRVAPTNPSADPAYDVDVPIILHDDTTHAGGFIGGMMNGTATGYVGHVLNGKTSLGQTPISVTQGQRVRFRFLNAAARSHYVVALDGHPMQVTHADGHRINTITTSALPIGAGERWDAVVVMNNPGVWSLAASDIALRTTTLVRGVVAYAGSTAAVPSPTFVPANLSTGSLLSYAQLSGVSGTPPITSTPTRTYPMVIGSTMGGGMGGGAMTLTINGQAWPNVTPYNLTLNDAVQLNFSTSGMMAGMMYHPMHLHGHVYRLMGTAGGTSSPPKKDTLLINPMGQVGNTASVQFIADNPGEWMFHCHDSEHQMMGMMNTFRYSADADADGLADDVDWDPLIPNPVLTIPETAASFVPGGAGSILVQARPSTTVDLWLGFPTSTPTAFPPLGTLQIDGPYMYAGTAVSGAGLNAAFPYAVPNPFTLSGVRFGLQAVTWGPNGATPKFSSWHPITFW